ncbi:hypothetical protein Tco_0726982 [Tanacetum coccineum]|uniref:Uncharacterized protein n=1 Tax=Tanacetum coccineum TaxID=301880 RepID=A0ABQ4YJD7_9ASTR
MLHLGDNSTRWRNLVGELVKEFPMYNPSWHKIEEDKKSHIMGWLMVYVDNKSSIKKRHKTVGPAQTCDVAYIRSKPPRMSRRHSRIRRLTIGLTLRPLPEPLKMLKTGQRARSSASRDPVHWLSFEISRWRASRPVSTRPSYRPSSKLTLMMAYLRRERPKFNIEKKRHHDTYWFMKGFSPSVRPVANPRLRYYTSIILMVDYKAYYNLTPPTFKKPDAHKEDLLPTVFRPRNPPLRTRDST